MIVDAKNVFDAVCKIETAGLQLEEKRTAIELLAIKQRLQQALVDLRWVNSDQQMSDALTKPGNMKVLFEHFRKVCGESFMIRPISPPKESEL
jgi:hypothetical protein